MINLIPNPQTVVFVPLEQLTSTIDRIVQIRIREKQAEDLQEKFLSPKETSKMFSPSVSVVTLDAWAEKGYLNKHYIGGRTYYKYSEVVEAVKKRKKYQRTYLIHN